MIGSIALSEHEPRSHPSGQYLGTPHALAGMPVPMLQHLGKNLKTLKLVGAIIGWGG